MNNTNSNSMNNISNIMSVDPIVDLNLEVSNIKVYDMVDSLKASGYPMQHDRIYESLEKAFSRASRLGAAKPASGHDCFLKGVVVNADFKFSQYIWQQAKRYSWFNLVSSRSTMHRILDTRIANNVNQYVSETIVDRLQVLIDCHPMKFPCNVRLFDGDSPMIIDDRNEFIEFIVSNLPQGFMLESRVTTNYLQLKTMYNQRKNHKLRDWHTFKLFCESLPYFKELIGVK